MATLIRKTFSVPPLGCNRTIIGDLVTKQAIVIDPGGASERILHEVRQLDLTFSHILHTHAHFDHFLASRAMKQATVDKGAYIPVSFDSLLGLTWPKSAEQHLMSEWTPSGRAFITQYLGLPIGLEGYIEAVREGVADPANCNRGDAENHFWRLSITKGPRDRRSEAVIAMSSPQTRVGHTWSAQFIRDFLVEGRVPGAHQRLALL